MSKAFTWLRVSNSHRLSQQVMNYLIACVNFALVLQLICRHVIGTTFDLQGCTNIVFTITNVVKPAIYDSFKIVNVNIRPYMNTHVMLRNDVVEKSPNFTFSLRTFQKLKTDVSPVTAINMQKSAANFSFETFPEDVLDMIPWFESASLAAQEFKIKAKTPAGAEQIMSLFSPFTMGYRWNSDEEIWAAADADINQLDAAAIIAHAAATTLDERAMLQEDDVLLMFTDSRFHRQSQVTLRQGLLTSVAGHTFHSELQTKNELIGPHDLYQGSRLVAHLHDLVLNRLHDERISLQPLALQISHDLLAIPDRSRADAQIAFLCSKNMCLP